MPINLEDFFKPITPERSVTSSDYDRVHFYIEAAKAFARSTYQSIYILDYHERGFLYVSDNPLFLCGYSSGEIKDLGYSFYFQQVPEDDLNLLLEINVAAFNFFKNIQPDERLLHTLSFDFHLTQPSQKDLLVHHKLTPLALDKKGKIWLAFCVVSVSSGHISGNIEIRKSNDDTVYEYDRKKRTWAKICHKQLNQREKEILYLSAQGYNNRDIADLVFLSECTIKFHKGNIFNKLKVKSIAEAVSYAITYKII